MNNGHVRDELPQVLLLTAASKHDPRGVWRFALHSPDGQVLLEVADQEPAAQGERLELLTVVRGLEALDHRSRVTLVNPTGYVSRGLEYGLGQWRQNGWTWECYGQMVPVKNRDLWQRLDVALRFHVLEVRRWRCDHPHGVPEPFAAAWRPGRAGNATRRSGLAYAGVGAEEPGPCCVAGAECAADSMVATETPPGEPVPWENEPRRADLFVDDESISDHAVPAPVVAGPLWWRDTLGGAFRPWFRFRCGQNLQRVRLARQHLVAFAQRRRPWRRALVAGERNARSLLQNTRRSMANSLAGWGDWWGA